MNIDERIERLTEVWAQSCTPFIEGLSGSAQTAVLMFAVVEIFRRIIVLNKFDKWTSIEKELVRLFTDRLHDGIQRSRNPFN
jgi:hypothetical protein